MLKIIEDLKMELILAGHAVCDEGTGENSQDNGGNCSDILADDLLLEFGENEEFLNNYILKWMSLNFSNKASVAFKRVFLQMIKEQEDCWHVLEFVINDMIESLGKK